jgi:hypothetical protein
MADQESRIKIDEGDDQQYSMSGSTLKIFQMAHQKREAAADKKVRWLQKP